MLLRNRYQILQQMNHMFNMASTRGNASSQCKRLTSIQLNKQELPKQPVPDLHQTAERYLRSLKPLLNDQEYSNTERIVKDFVSECGIGQKLQKKLLERYENTDNWMNEWFLNTAYLGYRDSVLLLSSPGTVGPPQSFRSPEDLQTFAAQLIVAVSTYNNLVKKGDIKQEMVGSTPLDMQPYALILGTHRIPGLPLDKQVHTDDSHHIIILKNQNIFKLPLETPSGPLTESSLIPSIKDIFTRSTSPGIPVGILTGSDRDTWAKDFEILKSIKNNKKIIKDIEDSLFILCLDRDIPPNAFTGKNNLSVRARQALTGYSTDTNAGNRWHDKTLQFILSNDGFIGTEYEHSPCEGGPIGVIQDFVLKYVENNKNSKEYKISKDFPEAELLKFEVDERINKSIENATKFVDRICGNIDMECFSFGDFGAGEIKKFRMSPDSFIQVAMQVCYYRLHGRPAVHYESGGLRRFRNTRTEAIRSTSIESVDFARIMAGEGVREGRKEGLIRAINAHKRIAGEAVTGAGIDRHLFGLKMISKEEKLPLPEIYDDIGFTRSCHWTLTSSQVPFKTASFMCYGPVVEDGYGCCYNPRAEEIFFACSSFNSCDDTCTKKFADTLRKTLCDMRNIAAE